MVDSSNSKRPAIPDWQKNYVQSAVAPQSPKTSHSSNLDDAPSSDAGLVEQAKRWLGDASLRDAPREAKITFLEGKGLQRDDIHKLFSLLEKPEAESEIKAVDDTASSMSTTKASSSASLNVQAPSGASSTPASREVPPIITYPEFLLRPEKPPPLVTFQRLAYATYGFAGLTALTYGAGKYLVQPMLDSLAAARHDFAGTALQNLEKLNSKLENNVSHVPYVSSSPVLKRKVGFEFDEDVESIESDPTELFHRDIATQTSPLQSRNSSQSSSTSLDHMHRDANPTTIQATRLSAIHNSLSSLLASTSHSTTSNNTESLKSTVEDLEAYLDKLQFSNNSFSTSSYDHIYPGLDVQKSLSKKNKTGDEDEAEKFKAEIRAVKGTLLSSRTFPAGKRAVGSGGGMGMVGVR